MVSGSVTRAALCLLWLSATCWAVADDGAVSGVGGAVHKLKGPPTVRMVAETVSIKVPTGKVRAAFTFQNDGPATDVTMGFPETGDGARGIIGNAAKGSTFAYFRSWVDGKAVKCRRMRKSYSDDGDATISYEFWWVKKVHFAAGQRHNVVDEYQGAGGWNTSGGHWITYTLITGATWKGNIGYAKITADVGDLGNTTFEATPHVFRRSGHELVWEFRNFKPSKRKHTDELNIAWYPGFKAVWFNGRDLSDDIQPSTMDEYSGFWPYLTGSELTAPVDAIASWIGADVSGSGEERTLTWHARSGKVRTATVCNGSKLIRSSTRDRKMTKPALFVVNKDSHEKVLVVRVGPLIRALGGTARYDPVARIYHITLKR